VSHSLIPREIRVADETTERRLQNTTLSCAGYELVKLPDGSTSMGDINASFSCTIKEWKTKDAVEYRVNIVAARHVTWRGYKCAWIEDGTSPDSQIVWISLSHNVNWCY